MNYITHVGWNGLPLTLTQGSKMHNRSTNLNSYLLARQQSQKWTATWDVRMEVLHELDAMCIRDIKDRIAMNAFGDLRKETITFAKSTKRLPDLTEAEVEFLRIEKEN